LILPSHVARADDNNGNMKVRVLFALHAPKQAVPDWPNIGYNFVPIMDKTIEALTNGCPGIDFIPTTATGPEEAQQIIDADNNIDGYIVMQMNCWNRVVQTTLTSGKPVLYADFPYAGSGGFLVYTAKEVREKTPNFAFLPSGKIDDLVEAAKCFLLVKNGQSVQDFSNAVTNVRIERTANVGDLTCKEDKLDLLSMDELFEQLKTARLLQVGGAWNGFVKETKESLGIDLVDMPFTELNDAWANADEDQAKEVAERWKKGAVMVDNISDETLFTSAKMYLGMKACLKNHNACGITVNCLGGFYGNHIHAYPCLGFHELLNEGLIGACECDNRSSITMITMTALTKGRPGYISDPVVDIANRQIIYAHCVASNKAFGPQGPANPYTIMTHSEDRQGASLRSTLPLDYMTSTLEFAPERKLILFHQAVAVDNSLEDRACRTKLAAVPVGDFEKIFTQWDEWGWHRVTYYGDLKESVYAIADRLGWKVIEEA